MNTKLIYNPNSTETISERKIFGGNSDGFINFTKMKKIYNAQGKTKACFVHYI